MAKPKLASLTIRPGKNGGHTITHEFQPAPQYSKGNSGGVYMGAPQSESHSFGPKDHAKMLQHLAQALALKQAAGMGALGGSPGGPGGVGAAPQDEQA